MKLSMMMIVFVVWFVPFLSDGRNVRRKMEFIEIQINLISNNINDLEKQFTSEPKQMRFLEVNKQSEHIKSKLQEISSQE